MIHREFNESVKLHQWLKWRDIRHTHIANETGGDFRRGALNKKMGVSKGFPDYLIFLPAGSTLHGGAVNVAIEMKQPDGSNKATKEQDEWLRALSAQGFMVRVCYGFEDAKQFITKGCGYIDDSIPSPKDNPF